MVIYNGYLLRPRVRPPEYDTPLVIDANGVEPRQPAVKPFQSIPRRNSQITQRNRLVHLNQLP